LQKGTSRPTRCDASTQALNETNPASPPKGRRPVVAHRDIPDDSPGRYPGWQDDRFSLPMRWCRDTVHSDYLEATASFIAMRLLTVAGAAQVAFDVNVERPCFPFLLTMVDVVASTKRRPV
jgi:hypothetical protein